MAEVDCIEQAEDQVCLWIASNPSPVVPYRKFCAFKFNLPYPHQGIAGLIASADSVDEVALDILCMHREDAIGSYEVWSVDGQNKRVATMHVLYDEVIWE